MITALQAFLGGKCPQCRRGKIFKSSILNKSFRETHTHCQHCKVKFESEPGFWWGAMYFSYALVVGTIAVSAIIIYSLQEEPPLFQTSAIIIAISVLLTPLHLRLSRLLMVYIAAPYRNFRKELYNKDSDSA